MNKIIEDIKKLRKESSVELDVNKCKFSRLLEDETVLNISKRNLTYLKIFMRRYIKRLLIFITALRREIL